MAGSTPSARRIYLTQRLVNKLITMEEATELFTLMTHELERSRRQGTSVPPPPPPPPPGGAPPPPAGAAGLGSLENLDELLLYGGPLLGILAALLKRTGMEVLGAPGPDRTAPPSASEGKGGEGSAKAPSKPPLTAPKER